MPSFANEYLYYVLEQLDGVGEVIPRRMFSGYGLYLDGLFCAIIASGVLYFKVDDTNREDYEVRGMRQFKPLHYYEVPVEVLEDRDQLHMWIRRAQAVAAHKAEKTPKKHRK